MPKYKFSTKKTKAKLSSKRPRDKEGRFVASKDPRLDELVPLFVNMLSRLLGSAGMMRYRKDFIERVKEVMDEEEKK